MSELTFDFLVFSLVVLGMWLVTYLCEPHPPEAVRRPVGAGGAGPTDGAPRPVPTGAPTEPPRARIDRLSDEQARGLSGWLASWSRRGVAGVATERQEVEDAIAHLYGDPGARRLRFKWVDSPWAAWLEGVRRADPPEDPCQFPSTWSILEGVCDELTHQLDRQVGPTLAGRVRIGLREVGSGQPEMMIAFNAHVISLGASDQPPFQRPALMDGAGSWFHPRAPWLACCRDVLGLAYEGVASARLDLFMRTAGCFAWWRPRGNLCVVLERPTVMHRDDRGRLHHPTDAAIRFRDGFSARAWHGVSVPAEWLTAPDRLRPNEVLTWVASDRRRAALEIIGWKRVLENLHPRIVNCDPDPAIGQLLEAELPREGTARFLRVRCGTGRDFVLAVPPEMRTALEANAWTYDLSPTEYHLEART